MRVNLVSVQYQPNIEVYKEWLTYHHALGFDKIFIFDNNVTLVDRDSAPPLPQIFDNVTVIKIKHKINGSQNFRWDYESLYLKDCDAYIVLDSDEYLYFNKNQSVQEFLSNYDDLDWNTLGVPWKDISSNVLIERGTSVVKDFTMIADEKYNGSSVANLASGERKVLGQIKSFVKTSAVNEHTKDHMHFLRNVDNVENIYGPRSNEKHNWIFDKAYNVDKTRATGFGNPLKISHNNFGCIYHYRWTYSNDIDKCLKRSNAWYNGKGREKWAWNRVLNLKDDYKKRWNEIFKDNCIEDLSMYNRFFDLGLYKRDKCDAIVSLTSYKPRLKYVPIVINRILKGTLLPKKIILNLYKDDVQYITPDLQKLIDNKKVELLVCNENLRSHLKYFYVMQKYRDLPIITIDDDTIYPVAAFDYMLEEHYKNPDLVLCRSCQQFTYTNHKINETEKCSTKYAYS